MEGFDEAIDEVVGRALAEDCAEKDITTKLLVGGGKRGSARIVAKAAGVVSGHEAAEKVFVTLDEGMEYVAVKGNGSAVSPGDVVAAIIGGLAAILSGERTALNFLQHLSGVATLTSAYAERLEGSGIILLDTRKTTPGLRLLEKMAVLHGGGSNHRMDLGSVILVKENHITAAGGLAGVARRLGREKMREVIVEVGTLDELRELRDCPPARIMLDNFGPESLATALAELGGWGSDAPEVEVSGGVTIESMKNFAVDGVRYISVGALTSSAAALDMSLMVEEVCDS